MAVSPRAGPTLRPWRIVTVEPLDAILRQLGRDEDTWSGDTLCAAACAVLEADAAALCLTGPLDHVVIGVDPGAIAALAERPSEDGEGPCVDAARSDQVVAGDDLTSTGVVPWPDFSAAAAELGFRSLWSWPLQIGAIRLGALTVFLTRARPLDDATLRRGSSFALAATELVLLTNDPASPSSVAAAFEGSIERRAVVHQASGMISAQLDVSLGDALSVLRARAWADGRSMTELARDVVARRQRMA